MDARKRLSFSLYVHFLSCLKTILTVTNFDSDMHCAYVDIGQGAGGEYKSRLKGAVYSRIILTILRTYSRGLSMK